MKRRLPFTIDQDGFLDGVSHGDYCAALLSSIGQTTRSVTTTTVSELFERYGQFALKARQRPRFY